MKAKVTKSEETVCRRWWFLSALLLFAAVATNHYYLATLDWGLRITAWLLVAALLLLLVMQTVQGRSFALFLSNVRSELRKVVWPGRQETVTFTVMVVVIVSLVALVLWLLDSMLLTAFTSLTRQGGA